MANKQHEHKQNKRRGGGGPYRLVRCPQRSGRRRCVRAVRGVRKRHDALPRGGGGRGRLLVLEQHRARVLRHVRVADAAPPADEQVRRAALRVVRQLQGGRPHRKREAQLLHARRKVRHDHEAAGARRHGVVAPALRAPPDAAADPAEVDLVASLRALQLDGEDLCDALAFVHLYVAGGKLQEGQQRRHRGVPDVLTGGAGKQQGGDGQHVQRPVHERHQKRMAVGAQRDRRDHEAAVAEVRRRAHDRPRQPPLALQTQQRRGIARKAKYKPTVAAEHSCHGVSGVRCRHNIDNGRSAASGSQDLH